MKYREVIGMMRKQAAMQKQADPHPAILAAQRGSKWAGTDAGLGLTPEQYNKIIANQNNLTRLQEAYDKQRTDNIYQDAGWRLAERARLGYGRLSHYERPRFAIKKPRTADRPHSAGRRALNAVLNRDGVPYENPAVNARLGKAMLDHYVPDHTQR